jgi:hypothetical protein
VNPITVQRGKTCGIARGPTLTCPTPVTMSVELTWNSAESHADRKRGFRYARARKPQTRSLLFWSTAAWNRQKKTYAGNPSSSRHGETKSRRLYNIELLKDGIHPRWLDVYCGNSTAVVQYSWFVIGQCCDFHSINSTVEIAWDIFRILADYRLRHLVSNKHILYIITISSSKVFVTATLYFWKLAIWRLALFTHSELWLIVLSFQEYSLLYWYQCFVLLLFLGNRGTQGDSPTLSHNEGHW